MCRRVVIGAVLTVKRLSLMKVPLAQVILQRFFCNHHVLLLHVMLELLMETVKSMNELVFARMHLPTLRAQERLMDKLLTAHELMLLVCEVVVIFLTAYRMIISVDLDVFQTLTAQWNLMIHALWTLK